jgi:hypothetical protein
MSVAMEVLGGEELHFGDSDSCHRASVLPETGAQQLGGSSASKRMILLCSANQ